MKIFHSLMLLLIITAFSFMSFLDVAEAGCWIDPNGAQGCNYSLTYTPMIDLPGVTNPNSSTSFASYASALYSVAIVVAALLAVIRLVLAGAKYMMTDVVSGKGEAINDIKGSLLGLLIIIAAFVILNTINPNLTKIIIAPGQQPLAGGVQNSGFVYILNGSSTTSRSPANGSCTPAEVPCLNQCFANPNCDPQTETQNCSVSPSNVVSLTCVPIPGAGTLGNQTATKGFFCGGICISDTDWRTSAIGQGIDQWCWSLGSGNGTFTVNSTNSTGAVATCTYQP